jgi:hypothetical protein
MPTARRKNRSAALAEPEQAILAPEPETLPPANMDPDTGEVPLDLSDLKRPPQLDFFAWIHQLPETLWGGRLKLYLYRTWPQVQNPGKYSNIGVYPFAIDEEFVRQEHGGGSYYMWLKDAQNRNSLERSPDFSIGGEPKLKPGQVTRADGTTAPTEVAPAPTAQPAPMPDNGIAQIISTLAEALKQHQDKPADQVIKDMLATMQVAQRGAIEIVTSAAKADIDANRPKNSIDQLKEVLELAKMLNPEPRNSFAEIRDVLSLVKEMRGGGDSGTSFLSELKDLIGPEAIKDALLGSRKSNGGGFDWRGQLVDMGKMLIQNGPMLLDRVAAIQAQAQMQQLRIIQANGKGPVPVALPSTQPPQLGAAPVEVPAIEPAPAAPAPKQVTQDMIYDSALQLIVDCFNAGDSGDDAALVVRRTFPKLAPLFVPMLTSESPESVIEWAKTNRMLSAIASDAEFPQFLREFTDGLKEEEQADAAGAGQSL